VPSAKIGIVQARVRKELAEKGLPVDPPEVTLTSADGREWKTILQYDEETGVGNLVGETDADSARNLSLWTAHQNALAQARTETWEQAISIYLSLGLRFDMPAEDSDEYLEWAEEMEFLGETVPDTRLGVKALYLTTCVLEDDELAQVLPKIMAVSQGDMVTEAEKEAYFRSFYGSMARAAQSRFIAAGAAIGGVADEPESSGAASGESVAPEEPE
jgi:hypothetical protein